MGGGHVVAASVLRPLKLVICICSTHIPASAPQQPAPERKRPREDSCPCPYQHETGIPGPQFHLWGWLYHLPTSSLITCLGPDSRSMGITGRPWKAPSPFPLPVLGVVYLVCAIVVCGAPPSPWTLAQVVVSHTACPSSCPALQRGNGASFLSGVTLQWAEMATQGGLALLPVPSEGSRM